MKQNWFAVTAQATPAAPVECFIYDEISAFGTTAKDFISAIQPYRDRAITLRINSPGGNLFDGLAIYNYLRPLNVTTQIDGIAASAASIIALAGRTVRIAQNGFLVVHNPAGICAGDSNDMATTGTALSKITDSMVATYSRESGQPEATVRAWMAAETWFTADEAKAAGLVDEISAEVAFSASLSKFTKPPTALAAGAAMSNQQVIALADAAFGPGFSQSMTMNVQPHEGRARLVKALYFARIAVPALALETAAIAAKHPMTEPRGADRVVAAQRQQSANAFLTTIHKAVAPAPVRSVTTSNLTGKARVAAAIRAEMNLPQ